MNVLPSETRFSYGWTDPRGCFGTATTGSKHLFLVSPSLSTLQELSEIPEDTLTGLWTLRFPTGVATAEALQDDPFYYAMGYVLFNAKKLNLVSNLDTNSYTCALVQE